MVSLASHLKYEPDALLRDDSVRLWRVGLVAGVGFALYGFSAGYWRSPMMGVFVALKMPLLIVLTLGFNSLLNAMLGMLLGSRLGLRGSLHALLSAFAISGLILGSLSPVTMFLALSLPSSDSVGAAAAHSMYVLSHTLLIALAGLAGVLRLSHLLAGHADSQAAARATLVAWIVGNAFLGAQFSWVLRPFFGSPKLEVAFLRPNPLRGSFHETLWAMASRTFGGVAVETIYLVIILAGVAGLICWQATIHHKNHQPEK